MRNLAHQSQKRLVLSTAKHILHILVAQAQIPFLILVDDILWTADEHRQNKANQSPTYQRQHKLHLMLGEEEECQSDNAI